MGATASASPMAGGRSSRKNLARFEAALGRPADATEALHEIRSVRREEAFREPPLHFAPGTTPNPMDTHVYGSLVPWQDDFRAMGRPWEADIPEGEANRAALRASYQQFQGVDPDAPLPPPFFPGAAPVTSPGNFLADRAPACFGPIVEVAVRWRLYGGGYAEDLFRGPLSALRRMFPDEQARADAERAGVCMSEALWPLRIEFFPVLPRRFVPRDLRPELGHLS